MRRLVNDEHGQSTVEYALVLMAFLSMILALGVLWHAVHEGRALRWAEEASSHNMGDGMSLELMQDVLSY